MYFGESKRLINRSVDMRFAVITLLASIVFLFIDMAFTPEYIAESWVRLILFGQFWLYDLRVMLMVGLSMVGDVAFIVGVCLVMDASIRASYRHALCTSTALYLLAYWSFFRHLSD